MQHCPRNDTHKQVICFAKCVLREMYLLISPCLASLICPFPFACDQTLARGGLKPNLDKHDSYPDFLPSPCGGPAQHGWWKDAVGHDVSKSAAMNLKHSPFFTSAVESISAISDVCSLLKKLKKCQLKTQICSAEAGPVGCIFMHGR